MLKLRTAAYNPLSIRQDHRIEDIARETHNFDIVALIGTQKLQLYDNFSKEQVANRLFVHAGYRHNTA